MTEVEPTQRRLRWECDGCGVGYAERHAEGCEMTGRIAVNGQGGMVEYVRAQPPVAAAG